MQFIFTVCFTLWCTPRRWSPQYVAHRRDDLCGVLHSAAHCKDNFAIEYLDEIETKFKNSFSLFLTGPDGFEPWKKTGGRKFRDTLLSIAKRLTQGWALCSFPFGMLRSFLEFLTTYETQKNVPVFSKERKRMQKNATFFCKERKWTRERFVLLQKNARRFRSFFFIYIKIYIDIYRYIYRYI